MASVYEPVPPASASVFKAVGAGLLLLAGATVVARQFLDWVNETTPAGVRWVSSMDTDRVEAIKEALPALAAKDEPAAFMLGPSAAFYGFIPDAFDAAMREHGDTVVSYNLGAIGNIAPTDRLMVRRLGEAFAAAGKQPELIMLPFAPLAATKGFLGGRMRSHVRKKAILSQNQELLSLFLTDAHESTELAALKVMGGIGPADSNSFLGKRIFNAPAWWPLSKDWELGEWESITAKVNAGNAPQLGKFDIATRGVFDPLRNNDKADYDKMAELAFAPENLKKQFAFWNTTDFENMPLEPERVEEFVLAVKEAQQIADLVVVVVPRSSEHVRPGPVGRKNLADALAKIESETGVQIVDLGEAPGFEQAEFVDFTHLKHDTGAPKFSRLLADAIAPHFD